MDFETLLDITLPNPNINEFTSGNNNSLCVIPGVTMDKFVGNFGTKDNRIEGNLIALDEVEQAMVAPNLTKPLRKGEIVLRYVTENTLAGGIKPLVKIKLQNKVPTISFVKDTDDEQYDFGTPVPLRYLNILSDVLLSKCVSA